MDKKRLTKNILSVLNDNLSIKNENIIKNNFKYKNEDSNIDSNSFVMVPINHPKIDEIMKLLNNIKENIDIDIEKEKFILTLNDVINSKYEKIIIPNNSIITPMAKDYIKQKKIEVELKD